MVRLRVPYSASLAPRRAVAVREMCASLDERPRTRGRGCCHAHGAEAKLAGRRGRYDAPESVHDESVIKHSRALWRLGMQPSSSGGVKSSGGAFAPVGGSPTARFIVLVPGHLPFPHRARVILFPQLPRSSRPAAPPWSKVHAALCPPIPSFRPARPSLATIDQTRCRLPQPIRPPP